MRRVGLPVLASALLTAAPALAFGPHRAPEERAGHRWEPMPMRCGEALAKGGPEEVGPGRSCVLHLPSGAIARLRHAPDAPLELTRVVGDGVEEPRLEIDEPGLPAERGVTLLEQPLGGGDLWRIAAEAATTVEVERLVSRRGRLVWEEVRADGLRWIEGDAGNAPVLPPCERCPELERRLAAERELGEWLSDGERDGAIARAVTAWRRASFALRLETVLPTVGRVASRREVRWQAAQDGGAGVDGREVELTPPAPARERPYHRVPEGTGSWRARLVGPGALRVDVRALLGAETREREPVRIAIAREGVELAERRFSPGVIHRDTARDDPSSTWEALRTRDDGRLVSERATLVVPLAPGEHDYELRVSGGPVLLRALDVHRRPRLAEWVGGEPSVRAEIDRARAQLERVEDPERRALLELLVDALDRPLELEEIERIRAALGGAAADDGALAWELRLGAARRLRELGDAAAAAREVEPRDGFPPSAALAPAGPLLDEPADPRRRRSRRLAALDLAARGDPGDREAAALRKRVDEEATRWSALAPEDPRTRERLSARWIDLPDPGAADDARTPPWHPGALRRLEAGATLDGIAPRSAFDPERPAILRAWIVTPGGAPGSTRLAVDDTRFTLVAPAAVEPVELALRPGAHRVGLEAPASVEAWVALPPTSDAPSAPHAHLRRFWRIGAAGAAAPRFVVPDPHLGRELRLELRAPWDASESASVRVLTELGEARRLRFHPPAEARRDALAVGDGGALGPSVRFRFALPAQAERVWIESDDPLPLHAQLTVRAPAPADAPGLPEAPPAPPGDEAERIALVERSSRRLAEHPEDVDARLARAHALLDLDEPSLARQDLDALVARGDLLDHAGARRAVGALAERLDAWSEAEHALSRAPAGTLEEPASLTASLVPEPVDGASHERERWRAWALGRKALATEEATRADAPVAFGIAEQMLERLELPDLRRARIETARASRWRTVRDVAAGAGRELVSTPAAPEGGRATRVRGALLAAPWPSGEGVALLDGRGTRIRVDDPAALGLEIELACRAIRAEPRPRPCRLRWRLDGQAARERRVQPGTLERVSVALDAGRHRLEIEHADDDRRNVAGARVLVRGVDGQARPLETRGRALHFAARADTPVVLWVAGPTTLRVEARAPLGTAPGTLEISATPEGEGPAVRGELVLAEEVDPAGASVGDGAVALSAPRARLLVLPEARPYRVVARPSGEGALLRLSYRAPAASAERPEPPAPSAVPPDRMAWPLLPEALGELPATAGPRAPSKLGTLSVGVGYRGEDVGEADLSPAGFRDRAELGVAWRRHAEDGPYLRVEGLLRKQAEAEPALGGTAAGYWSRLGPHRTRLLTSAELFAQSVEGDTEAGLGAFARVDQPLRLDRDLELLARLGFRIREYTLDSADRDEVDPRVFRSYGADHPRALAAELELRWSPFQDQRLSSALAIVQNADLVSVDHVDLELAWNGTIGLGGGPIAGAAEPRFRLRYRPSLRLDDEHRSDTYLRHELGAAVAATLWTGSTGRFLLELRDDLYVGPEIRDRNAFTLGLRYDWTSGRGLRDVLPTEELFRERTTDRRWADED